MSKDRLYEGRGGLYSVFVYCFACLDTVLKTKKMNDYIKEGDISDSFGGGESAFCLRQGSPALSLTVGTRPGPLPQGVGIQRLSDSGVQRELWVPRPLF